MRYSQQLKVIRIQNKFTQQQLADALGITRSAYCGYEIGRRSPDLETIIKMSEFYNLSLTDFFKKMEDIVNEERDFDDANNEWLISKLTKDEIALIAKVRTMSAEDKKEVYNLAKSKVKIKD